MAGDIVRQATLGNVRAAKAAEGAGGDTEDSDHDQDDDAMPEPPLTAEEKACVAEYAVRGIDPDGEPLTAKKKKEETKIF